MALYKLELVGEPHQPRDVVLLTCFDGAQTLQVIILRADVEALQPGLSMRDQDNLIRSNAETLLPVIQASYDRGDATHQETNRATGRSITQIVLTRSELEQGLKTVQQVVPGATIPSERVGLQGAAATPGAGSFATEAVGTTSPGQSSNNDAITTTTEAVGTPFPPGRHCNPVAAGMLNSSSVVDALPQSGRPVQVNQGVDPDENWTTCGMVLPRKLSPPAPSTFGECGKNARYISNRLNNIPANPYKVRARRTKTIKGKAPDYCCNEIDVGHLFCP